MKIIFTVIFIYFTNVAFASNYYFSSVTGSDSRTIAEAQNPATPWKTLDKLNSFFGSLQPGDSVLLKRDEIFYGSIIVKRSGSVTDPIVIGAYGSGSKPVITSLVKLARWDSVGKGIWESYNPSFGSTVNMVLLNGVEQEMGRYPNSDTDNNGYLTYESHNGKTAIIDNELDTSVNWKGAELVLRLKRFILERSLITAQLGHKIFYTTTSAYIPSDSFGYFIQNSVKTLDKVGEWYYDSSTKKLSVYFGSKQPSSYVVQAATNLGDLVSSSKYSNIVFDSLVINGSNGSGFFIEKGYNIYIQNCDILFSGITGALVHGHTNLHIENCTFANSNNNAIDLEYGVDNAVIRNNTILNTATRAGMLQNGEGTGLAVYTNGDGNTIEMNHIRKTGFIGITFYGNDVTIKNNFIDSFCFVKDDGGGIYTHGGIDTPVNRKLIGNIVVNGIGAGKGTDMPEKRAATGIYMDANTKNVAISENTVSNCHQGILLQSTNGVIVKNNTVFDNVRQLAMVQDKDNEPIRSNTIIQNIFFSKSPFQWASYLLSNENDIDSFGRFDSNYYARPLDDRITISINHPDSNGFFVTQNFDLGGWKKTYEKDLHSKKTAKQIAPYKIDSLISENKFINGDFNTSVKGISCSGCEASWSDSGLLDGGYLQVAPLSGKSTFSLKVGEVSAGKHYFLSYSARSSAADGMSLGTAVKQSAPPYTAVTETQSRRIDKLRTENEMLFSPLTSLSSAVVEFKPDAKSKYYLDNISFYEADAKVTDPDDSIRFEYNPTNITKTIALTGNYIDATGKLYINSITLRPYRSAVLIKTSDTIKNIAPTVSITNPANNKVFSSLSRMVITTAAADADGSIEKVEFYNDSTLLKTVAETPFECILDSIAYGTYLITARAFDNNGSYTISEPVIFTVANKNNNDSATTLTAVPSSIAQITVRRPPSSRTPEVLSITSSNVSNTGIFPGNEVENAPGNNTSSSAGKNRLFNQINLSELSNLQVFPDPAVNMIQVYFDRLQAYLKTNLIIQNASGKIVKKYPVVISGKTIDVDISSLSPGIYIIGLSSDNFAISKKFLKVNY